MNTTLSAISNVLHYDNRVTFWMDEEGVSCIVHKSISHIYLLTEPRKGQTIYTPVTFKDSAVLEAMCKLIKNEYVTDEEIEILNRVHIRYGWVDKNLKQLSFVKFGGMVKGFVNKTLNSTDKNKFNGIMKVLSLSVKDARKDHVIDGKTYNPLRRLNGD